MEKLVSGQGLASAPKDGEKLPGYQYPAGPKHKKVAKKKHKSKPKHKKMCKAHQNMDCKTCG